MGDYASGLLDTMFSFVSGVLPESPFSSGPSLVGIETALGWLNWAFPVSQCLQLFMAWIGSAVVVTAGRVVGRVVWDGAKDLLKSGAFTFGLGGE